MPGAVTPNLPVILAPRVAVVRFIDTGSVKRNWTAFAQTGGRHALGSRVARGALGDRRTRPGGPPRPAALLQAGPDRPPRGFRLRPGTHPASLPPGPPARRRLRGARPPGHQGRRPGVPARHLP